MDNQLKSIFFQLLRIGLWGEGTLSLDQPLTSDNWNEIHRYAIDHTIEGVIYDSFTFLEENQLPPQSLRLKWAVRIDRVERNNLQMNEVIAKQFDSFNALGLRPILQKGQGVARCYRIPLHRISGDIDWYFEADGYSVARNQLKTEGIAFQDTAGFSLDYDWQGVHIEHHKKLFDIRSPLKYSYLRKISKKYSDRYEKLLIHNISIRLLAPEMQLLQVNSHILKHLLGFGIGLRQFCDSARLYYTLSNTVDPIGLKQIYKKAGILRWIHLLHKILVDYIGLPKSYIPFPYPEDLDVTWMINEVWYAGSFGYNDERFRGGKTISTISVQPKASKRLFLNFLRYIKYAPQEALFYYWVQAYSKFIGKDTD